VWNRNWRNEDGFNDKSIDVMIFESHFESIQSIFNRFTRHGNEKVSYQFPIAWYERCTSRYEVFYILCQVHARLRRIQDTRKSNWKNLGIQYGPLRVTNNSVIYFFFPVLTVSVERFFSVMNRKPSKTRNRMFPRT